MKYFVKFLLAVSMLANLPAYAKEKITVFFPYAASASSTPAMLRVIDEANKMQSSFEFILEFKPGGNQALAVKAMDQNPMGSLALIAPAYVENHRSKLIDKNNYVPIWAMGDACWAVFTNVGDMSKGINSLAGTKELVVGGVGFGNAAHLTGIMLGEKYKFNTRYVVFKSNTDALVNMVGNNGVGMAIDKIEGYSSFKPKNDKLQVLAVSCPSRMTALPDVKTLKEQGIDAPSVFNIIIANKAMDDDKRTKIRAVLTLAAERMGADAFMKLSGLVPPQFNNISQWDFYSNSIVKFDTLLDRYKNTIESAKNSN
jgi:tripartite-type tricarboxylate transporter receptor subunit TctC